MGAIASQITSLTIVYSTVYWGANQRKHQSSASLTFVRRNHRWPVNSLHKWPVTRKMFPFDDVILQIVPIDLDAGNASQWYSYWMGCNVSNAWFRYALNMPLPYKLNKTITQILSNSVRSCFMLIVITRLVLQHQSLFQNQHSVC